VLAFFPGVYSSTCTDELREMRDWHADLAELDAQVFGVSADTPWSQLAFIEEYDLTFPLLSGFNNDVIADYAVRVGHRGRAVTDGDATAGRRRSLVDEPEDALVVLREPLVRPGARAVEVDLDGLANPPRLLGHHHDPVG